MSSIQLKTIKPRDRTRAHPKILLSEDMPPHRIVGALRLNRRTFDLQIGDRVIRLTSAGFDLLYHSSAFVSAQFLKLSGG